MSNARKFEDVLIALQAEAPAQLIGRIGELAQAHASELTATRSETWREAAKMCTCEHESTLRKAFEQRATKAQKESE